jgi:ferredoxin
MKPGFQTSIRCNQTVKIRFYEEGSDSLVEVDAPVGKRVLDIALENNIDIEGACGGELACSTCHVVVSPELYEKLPPKKEEEQDMLDLAWGVTDT